jgi:predicted methyltransferase
MLDLRQALAKALADSEEPMGEWTKDANGRPIQSLSFAVLDADGDTVVSVTGTLRVHAKVMASLEGAALVSWPSRKQVVAALKEGTLA